MQIGQSHLDSVGAIMLHRSEIVHKFFEVLRTIEVDGLSVAESREIAGVATLGRIGGVGGLSASDSKDQHDCERR